MKTIVLYGLRRSGNHFVISNILNQFTNSVHINDCRNFSFDEYQKHKNIPITKHSIDHTFTGFSGCDCIFISVESSKVNYSELNKFQNINDFHPILLLRNPYHNISSAWKIYTEGNKPKSITHAKRLNEVINLWPYYAQEYLKNTMHNILYDEFVNSIEYRKSIFNILGIQIKENDNIAKIKWQKSSFNNQVNVAKTYGELKDSVFYGETKYMNIFNDPSFEVLWNKVINKSCT